MPRENWLVGVLRKGIEPTYEANASRYVHETLRHCLGWPMAMIIPQASKRGFIDYRLQFPTGDVSIHVEVKRFRAPVGEEHIRKYLVRRGRPTMGLSCGVVTNLHEWQIFVAGAEVREATGSAIVHVATIHADRRAGIRRLRALIGYRGSGALRNLRAELGESEEALLFLLYTDDKIIQAVRKALVRIRMKHRLDVRVPQNDRLAEAVRRLLAIRPLGRFPFSTAKLRLALRSHEVAAVVNQRLVRVFRARSRLAHVRRTLMRVVSDHGAG